MDGIKLRQSAAHVHFPAGLLTAALVVTGVVLSWLGGSAYRFYCFTQATQTHYQRTQELRSILLDLNDVLSTPAPESASSEADWVRRLHRVESRLNSAVTMTLKRAPQSSTAYTGQIKEAERRLEEIRQNQAPTATVISDLRYVSLKGSFIEAVSRFIDTQESDVNSALGQERSRALLSVVLATGGLLLSLLTWIAVLRSLRRWRLALLELSERKQAEEALRLSERRFRSLIQNTTDVIAILDADGRIRYLSPGVERMWGRPAEELHGGSAFALVHENDLARAETLLHQVAVAPDADISSELRLRHADGSWRTCEVILNNLLAEPSVEGLVITYHDITERKAFEDQLAHQAFHDSLSGLPNRALFMDRLGHALARAKRHNYLIAVLFLDLDNFKVVNDSLGHQAGDHLLKAVTERLQSCARPEDTVARLGGDEFTILLENLRDIQDAVQVAERITAALQQPIILQSYEVFATASVGIAASMAGQGDPDSLLRDADIAMYQAKSRGKALHVLFDRSMNTLAMERLQMEAELRRAIENGELRIHYQPIMDLANGRVSEVEALVRWQHPRYGMVSPDRFIPLAEETGLIIPLGHWVLREACRQAQDWHSQNPDEPPIVIGVNLSVKQVQQPDLVEQVSEILRETGLNPLCLKLEITESVMMLNAEATIGKLYELRELGIGLAVDDFGTGYSSMAYLSRFPIDTLKIDQSFIGRLGQQPEDDAIVRAIIGLAKTLNLRVTSEGIETLEQLTELQALGCDRGQGYLFARPLNTTAVNDFMAAARKMPLASPAAPEGVAEMGAEDTPEDARRAA